MLKMIIFTWLAICIAFPVWGYWRENHKKRNQMKQLGSTDSQLDE